mmetsp:Transcript_31957/g.38630  ORF Transcript_31957/g.38630 Transcript_31957/m.38630 type:complete len:449 (-) Transcript_31957:231-1577(-)|eukprot:CAMPEP_0197856476 /NCGR_PEP_ID=MMETSP1438-20131217/28622_1 /TAXON_ID=1461541 /ORGANISM="Pterosperma sp., Strain CCMP1384" /LENGTH=448 /DNA_ID=CAMNT_0043471943 /DNA_START=190 /DNA_END=1536 /DNA_ORIENTATION=+
MDFQAVVLAGGEGARFGVLTSEDVPKALVPVGNKALLTYPLDMFKAAGFTEVIVVAQGEAVGKCISRWAETYYQGTNFTIQVVATPEGTRSADCIRIVQEKLTGSDFIVMSGDLLTDVPIVDIVGFHLMKRALCTALLGKRKNMTDPETGKPATPMDYIGLDNSKEKLIFCAPASMIKEELKVRRSVLRSNGMVNIMTDLMDAHLYIFNREVLNTLEAHRNILSIKGHLLPYLARRQVASAPPSSRRTSLAKEPIDEGDVNSSPLRGGRVDDGAELSGAPSPNHTQAARHVGVNVMLRTDKYCSRVNTLQTYAEANREVVSTGGGGASSLLGVKLSTYENIVHPTAKLGNRSTVGAHCIVGEHCELGDKCSIKRTVLGKNCIVGNNVKVIDSVIGDNVTLADGCHVQSSVICANAELREKCKLRDCQVAQGFTVGQESEHRSQQLSAN